MTETPRPLKGIAAARTRVMLVGLIACGALSFASQMEPLQALAAVRSVAKPPSGEGPVLGPLAARLESLAPGASGVFLAEVSRISEHDDRGLDGDEYQTVEFRLIRASGLTRASLYLVREGSGYVVEVPESLLPPPPKISFSVGPDMFQTGRRYWFATASSADERYPNGIAGFWPAESTAVASSFERAVEENAYAWHPETWPSGYVTGWFDDSTKQSSKVRVWRAGRLLWEKRLDGALTHNLAEGWHVHPGNEVGYMAPPDLPIEGEVLLVELRSVLDSVNVFDLPARVWRVQQLLDMSSGKTVASRVSVYGAGDAERAYQSYDRHGRLTYERIQDFLQTGGKSVGSDREGWLRRVERWLDPRNGRLVREEVSRYAIIYSKLGSSRSDWVPVDPKLGLAAAPVRGKRSP